MRTYSAVTASFWWSQGAPPHITSKVKWHIGHMSVMKCPLSQKTSNKTSAIVLKWKQCGTRTIYLLVLLDLALLKHGEHIGGSTLTLLLPPLGLLGCLWKRSKTVRMVEKKKMLCSATAQNWEKKVSHELLFPINYHNSHCFLKISYWWVIRLSHNLESQIMHNWFGEIIIWKSANILCISLHLKIWVVTWSQQKEVKSGSKAIMNEDFTSRW